MTVHQLKEYTEALREAGLLSACDGAEAIGSAAIENVSYDTRSLTGKAALFICKGAHFKEEYLHDAIAHGAVAYVSETRYDVSVPCLLVRDIRQSLVVLGRLFYDGVTDKLTSVGITGTKGKSTVAYYLRAILDDWLTVAQKPRSAVISSISVYDGKNCAESHITTPEVLELYQHFQNACDSGISHLTMEVSSQALKYGRVRGMTFDVACFTNIGTDHISPIEHPDFEDYYTSKLKIFDQCRIGCVNTDADCAERTLAYARERCKVLTFGSHETDDLFCRSVEKRADGIYFTVRSSAYNGEFSITMPGLFNVSNALAAMTMAMALGVPEAFVRSGLRRARVDGRMEVYESRDRQVVVIVDYAHNRMSFEALFRSAKLEYPDYDRIAVFGSAGGKALQRRKDLGEVSGQNCVFVYVTEDDSGEEPFEHIAADITPHIQCPHLALEDREECIRRAILEHHGKRLIILAGKGSESCRKRGTAYIPFPSDAECAQKYLAQYDQKKGKL